MFSMHDIMLFSAAYSNVKDKKQQQRNKEFKRDVTSAALVPIFTNKEADSNKIPETRLSHNKTCLGNDLSGLSIKRFIIFTHGPNSSSNEYRSTTADRPEVTYWPEMDMLVQTSLENRFVSSFTQIWYRIEMKESPFALLTC